MSGKPLTLRHLNRATLSRQLLVGRQQLHIAAALAHLVGLQAQVSENPYQGLWSRLAGFRHTDLTALIVGREVARATSLRGTLHLHVAGDLVALRPLVQPVLDRVWQAAFLKRFGGADREAVLRAGTALLDDGPMTAGELGARLAPRFPGAEPLALATHVQMQDILVQVPPTRIWGSGHAPILSRAANWLGPIDVPPLSRAMLVRRYLGAHGPASVADIQAWCGLTGLATEVEALGDALVPCRDESGRKLFDLAGATPPEPDLDVPVRFLPDFDNALIGYADRRRILDREVEAALRPTRSYRAVLVDGFVAATWSIRGAKGTARLLVTPFRRLEKPEIRDIEAEAGAFLTFMAEDVDRREVVFGDA